MRRANSLENSITYKLFRFTKEIHLIYALFNNNFNVQLFVTKQINQNIQFQFSNNLNNLLHQLIIQFKLFQKIIKIYKMTEPSQTPQSQSDLKFENMTRQELKRIQKSMKKPQFMGLLNEYMIQISDPKNRQQYDQYLKQMQQQGQLPKNMKLAELTAQFCIRTNIVSQKNKKHNMKFFINYCSTQFIQQPTCEPSQNQQGKAAFGWKVPNSMGKIRYDQDKSGKPCQVADVGFNPKCFQIVEAQNNLPFRKNQFKSMLISIGLQCAQKQLGQRKQTLSKDYDLLKNLKCKGGQPALLPLRYIKGKAYNKGQGPSQNLIERDTQGKQTKLQKEINERKQASQQQNQQNQAKGGDNLNDQMEQDLQDKKVLVQDLQQGLQQPKYSSIYTYPVDYSQFLQDPSYAKVSKTPSHFTVEFKLPRVQEMQQIGGDGLTVNENRIVLKIGQKYFIDLPFEVVKLKYKLLTQKIKAKFDKKKRILRVILTVDQSVKYDEAIKQRTNTENQNQNQVNDEKQELVQNQVWKNKVLELTEPNVDLKVIENQQQQQTQIEQVKKKLIQEIDQDDYPEQSRNTQNSLSAEPRNIQQALNQQKNQAFSLRKYYNKSQSNVLSTENSEKVSQKPNHLTFVFQQTNDKVILVIKMQNYKKQEVKAVFDRMQSNNFFIQWDQNKDLASRELNKIHIINFKINESHSKDIKKIQIVYRVNFVAIFLHKNTLNRFWEKQSIQTIELGSDDTMSEYERFNVQREKIQTLNKQRSAFEEMEEKIKQEQKKELQQNNKVNLNQNSKSSSGKQLASEKQQKGLQNQIQTKAMYSVDNQSQSNKIQSEISKLQGQYFNFNNLPPQFIQFDIKFIEAID